MNKIGLAILLIVFGIPAWSETTKPNIVIVIADQWRGSAFGYAGDPNVKTPVIDQFEKQCVNFTNAVSSMPVCSPTRATLLTGQRPQTHGIFLNDVPLNPDATTLPKILKANGYDTACIGKWHVDGHGRSSFIPKERRQGFEYWKVLECTHDYNKSPYYSDANEKLMWEGYDALAQTHDANTYIQSRKGNSKPFLLWLAWGPPHNPYETAPLKYRKQYAAESLKLNGNVPPSSEMIARGWLAGYYAHCSALDDCFGELLAALKDAGVYENTIIVFTSDHGDMLGAHGQQRKQRPYEESACVPLLFKIPEALKIKPARMPGCITTEDIMPTLLSLCGQEIPKSVEGLDFSGYLRGGVDPSGGAAVIRCISPFGEFEKSAGGREYRAVRTAQYTYVKDLSGPWLLFDNQKDPGQLENLAGKDTKLQEQMERLLNAKLKEHHDEFLPGIEYIKKWGYKVNANGTIPIVP